MTSMKKKKHYMVTNFAFEPTLELIMFQLIIFKAPWSNTWFNQTQFLGELINVYIFF